MILLHFTQEELYMLKEILESYLSDLRMEIADTDKMDFRENLKKKENFLFIPGVWSLKLWLKVNRFDPFQNLKYLSNAKGFMK